MEHGWNMVKRKNAVEKMRKDECSNSRVRYNLYYRDVHLVTCTGKKYDN